jgi:hypothetical protein
MGPNRYILLGVVVFQVRPLFRLYIDLLVSNSKQLMKHLHETEGREFGPKVTSGKEEILPTVRKVGSDHRAKIRYQHG